MHSFIRWPGIKSVFCSVDIRIVLSELNEEAKWLQRRWTLTMTTISINSLAKRKQSITNNVSNKFLIELFFCSAAFEFLSVWILHKIYCVHSQFWLCAFCVCVRFFNWFNVVKPKKSFFSKKFSVEEEEMLCRVLTAIWTASKWIGIDRRKRNGFGWRGATAAAKIYSSIHFNCSNSSCSGSTTQRTSEKKKRKKTFFVLTFPQHLALPPIFLF